MYLKYLKKTSAGYICRRMHIKQIAFKSNFDILKSLPGRF